MSIFLVHFRIFQVFRNGADSSLVFPSDLVILKKSKKGAESVMLASEIVAVLQGCSKRLKIYINADQTLDRGRA